MHIACDRVSTWELYHMHIACYRVSTWELYQMHIACYRVNTWELYHLHIACYRVSTWELYRMHFCMLLIIIFLIVTVDKEYHIIVLIPHDFVFQTSIVSAESNFFSFLLAFAIWVSIRVNVSREGLGCTICCPLQLFACSCIFDP